MNVRNNYCNYEIDHDEGTEDNQTNQKSHRKYQGARILIAGLLVQRVKFKLSQDHDDYFEKGFSGILKFLVFWSKADDKESEAEANDHNNKGDYSLNDFLSNGVEHDAESSAKKWISSDHEYYLNPGQTYGSRGHNVQNILKL